MKNINGIVFAIHRASLHDGPGLRTTVFLKGCPLNCLWCHNPESICPDVEPDRLEPGKMFGYEISVKELMDLVEKDRAYYESSGGGLTLSGGEPMHQHEFTEAVLMAAKDRGIHTCLDTSGYASKYLYRRIDHLVDLFHFDFKAADPEQHKQWTGVDPDVIRENLRMLYDRGANIILRCPIIPGLNDTDEHFQAIGGLVQEMPRLQAEILPWHNTGKSKWARVGKDNPLPSVSDVSDQMKNLWKSKLLAGGLPGEQLVMS